MTSSSLWGSQLMQYCFDFVKILGLEMQDIVNNLGPRNARHGLCPCAVHTYTGGTVLSKTGGNISDCFHPSSPATHFPTKFLVCSMVKTDFFSVSCYAPQCSQLHQIMLVPWESLLQIWHILWWQLCVAPRCSVWFLSLDCNYTIFDPLHLCQTQYSITSPKWLSLWQK